MDKAAKLAMTEAYKVLQDCLSAISTMSADSLGRNYSKYPTGYTCRDELESNIVEAKAILGVHMDKDTVKILDRRDPFMEIRERREHY